MHDTETRALRRTALLLLTVSALRWAWPEGGGPPVVGEATDSLLAASQEALADAEQRSRPLEPGERIDLNRASASDLDRLPGVGAAVAQAIVEERELAGPFLFPGDLSRVRGIGPATVAKVEPYVALSRPPSAADGRARPRREPMSSLVDINRAGVGELVQLPGIGPALAARIVESREKQMFAEIEDLVRVRGIGLASLERLRGLVTVGGGRPR